MGERGQGRWRGGWVRKWERERLTMSISGGLLLRLDACQALWIQLYRWSGVDAGDLTCVIGVVAQFGQSRTFVYCDDTGSSISVRDALTPFRTLIKLKRVTYMKPRLREKARPAFLSALIFSLKTTKQG